MVDVVHSPLYDTWLETNRHILNTQFCNETGNSPINTEWFPMLFSLRCEAKYRQANAPEWTTQVWPVAWFELKTPVVEDTIAPNILNDVPAGTILFDMWWQDEHIELCYYGWVLLWFKKDWVYYTTKHIRVKWMDSLELESVWLWRLRWDALVELFSHLNRWWAEPDWLLELLPNMFWKDLTITSEGWQVIIECDWDSVEISQALASCILDPFTYSPLF